MDMSKLDAEEDAIRRRYGRRPSDAGAGSVYHPVRLDRLLLRHRKEALIAAHLRRHWLSRLEQIRVLEVGCGTGANLNMFLMFGVPPANLTGVELLPERASEARRLLPPAIELRQGDAIRAGFPAESFEIIVQSTVFSSILARDVRVQLANEMWNWLKPGGTILWYDLAFDNPQNPDVAGIPRKEIRELFPHADLEVHRVTLAPPIARRAIRAGAWLYQALDSLPFLRSHILAWARKPAAAG